MKRSESGGGAAAMEGLRQRIERWRQTRKTRGAMPAPLWEAAVALARMEGLYATARGLHIDYGTLKWRLERSPEKKPLPKAKPKPKPAAPRKPTPKPVPRPKFMELAPALTLSPASGSSVELVGRDGAKLSIQLRGGEALDVVALIREFWGRRP